MDAITAVPTPVNEPVLTYAPGSAERAALQAELDRQTRLRPEFGPVVAGARRAGGATREVTMPSEHKHVLATVADATADDAQAAVDGALAAAPQWRSLSPDDRAAVFLKAADLLAGPWRQRLNAATMLGQGKTAHQAEIDSACELVDFWRFNVAFARQVQAIQPQSSPGVWNRSDHRPLDGFVYAVTPFNFTAIAGNLPTAPALMGNTVIWKPAPTQQLAASLTLDLLEQAGLPPGVISMLPGDGPVVSDVVLASRDLAGIHFTGSTPVFQHLWRTVGQNIDRYRSYPRLVGETGGKDFVLAHPSADVDVLCTALIRGAFEYSGQKCSAASRAYVPRSLWPAVRERLAADVDALAVGDVRDFSSFTSAVIDGRSFARLAAAIDRAAALPGARIVAGGQYDDSTGWFVRPTVVEADDPTDELFTREYFGPLLAVHVYDDATPHAFTDLITHLDATSQYALTGAVIAQDRAAIATALEGLRFAAGNVYVNDKPTGAVVGQQPFGGGRASGTNDKAGSILNLLRWVSPRSMKETFDPPTTYGYPSMG